MQGVHLFPSWNNAALQTRTSLASEPCCSIGVAQVPAYILCRHLSNGLSILTISQEPHTGLSPPNVVPFHLFSSEQRVTVGKHEVNPSLPRLNCSQASCCPEDQIQNPTTACESCFRWPLPASLSFPLPLAHPSHNSSSFSSNILSSFLPQGLCTCFLFPYMRYSSLG